MKIPIPKTFQEAKWLGKHGKEYSHGWVLKPWQLDKLWEERITGGVTRSCIINKFIGDFDRNTKILEVGCNVGNQLAMLSMMGFKNLHGIELIPEAVQFAHRRGFLRVEQGSALDLLYLDKSFDLVMACWVLSHIGPEHVKTAVDEIKRVGKHAFITENWAEKEKCVTKNYLWQRNHLNLFLDEESEPGVHKMFRVLEHEIYPPAKPSPSAPSHSKGRTDAFLLRV